jgi:signal transduction histidine kinase
MRIGLLIAVVAMVVLVGSYVAHTQRVTSDVVAVLSSMHALGHTEARIGEAVLERRMGVGANADALTEARRAAATLVARLRTQSRAAAGIPEFETRIARLAELVAEREQLVDTILTDAASVSASGQALWRLLAAAETAGCFRGDIGREAAAAIRSLATRAFWATPDAPSVRLQTLLEIGAHPLPGCRPLLTDFGDHAEVLLAAERDLAAATATYLALPLRATVARLLDDGSRLERRYAARARMLSVALLAVVLVLSGLIYQLIRRLLASAAALRTANAELEQRVELQTQDLRRANDSLRADLLERERMQRERDVIEVQLRQAQKLEAVGMLASGVAHEINTPIQYVGDNVRFLQGAFAEALASLELVAGAAAGAPADFAEQIEMALAGTDLDYLREETPRAIEQSLEGIERVAGIVRSMRDFAHPGDERTAVDLNRAIESTLTVARNEWKYVADAVLDLAPDLPLVPCNPGEINQVLLNILVNGAHAIAEKRGGDAGEKGTITIRSGASNGAVEIQISDTGAGIPEEVRDRIFDPFFTTKGVGRGTGQGLNIAHTVVVQKHGGALTFDSVVGEGTTFTIRLPLETIVATGRVAVEYAVSAP